MKPYRTLLIAHSALVALLLGLGGCAVWKDLVAVYPIFAGTVGGIVGLVAARAYGEHRENAKAQAAQ